MDNYQIQLDNLHVIAKALDEACRWNWLDDEMPPDDVVEKVEHALKLARDIGVL